MVLIFFEIILIETVWFLEQLQNDLLGEMGGGIAKTRVAMC